MDREKAEGILKGASQKELIDIIWKMTTHSREAENVLISWGRKNTKAEKELVYEAELRRLYKLAIATKWDLRQKGRRYLCSAGKR